MPSPRWTLGVAAWTALFLAAATATGQPSDTPQGPAAPGAASAPWSAADLALIERLDRDGPGALDDAAARRLAFWSFHLANLSLLVKRHDGALVAEDFDAPLLRQQREVALLDGRLTRETYLGDWRLWQSDPGLTVEQLDGALVLHGRTTSSGGQAFTGLVGPEFGNTDVVALARVRPLRPSPDLAGRQVTLFHLCGSDPDVFHEAGFGQQTDGSLGWQHGIETLPGLAGAPAATRPGRDDVAEWTVRLEHEAGSGSGRAWAFAGADRGQALPGTAPLPLPTVKLELKLDAPVEGLDVECRFDDVRLYPRPENHPLRVLVVAAPVTGGAPLAGLTISLVLGDVGPGPRPWLGGRVHGRSTESADTPPGITELSATTDELGRAELHLPASIDYPASARLRVSLSDGPGWEWIVRAGGVQGVYPDDTWVLRLNERELRGDDGWWKPLERQTRR